MQELEAKEILTVDYCFIPFINKNEVILREDKTVYKDDLIVNNDYKKEYSPVSGLFNGVVEITSVDGPKNVIIIENNFKDQVEKKKISIEDIYKLKSDTIGKIWKPKSSEIILEIKKQDNDDLRDEFLLNDHMNEILQTLDILDQTYPDIEVSILLDKSNIRVYQSLFSYLGTYPNIKIDFNKSNHDGTILTLYETIDIYNELKNTNTRDYIYLTLVTNNEFNVIKTKRNSNLKDLLESLSINPSNIIINGNMKLSGTNFLLNESIYKINIK